MAILTGADVKAIREELGLSQQQLSLLMGYGDKARVSEIERSARKPSAAAVRLLIAYKDGYRPNDWPVIVEDKKTNTANNFASNHRDL